jgi:hypothetical protein
LNFSPNETLKPFENCHILAGHAGLSGRPSDCFDPDRLLGEATHLKGRPNKSASALSKRAVDDDGCLRLGRQDQTFALKNRYSSSRIR